MHAVFCVVENENCTRAHCLRRCVRSDRDQGLCWLVILCTCCCVCSWRWTRGHSCGVRPLNSTTRRRTRTDAEFTLVYLHSQCGPGLTVVVGHSGACARTPAQVCTGVCVCVRVCVRVQCDWSRGHGGWMRRVFKTKAKATAGRNRKQKRRTGNEEMKKNRCNQKRCSRISTVQRTLVAVASYVRKRCARCGRQCNTNDILS